MTDPTSINILLGLKYRLEALVPVQTTTFIIGGYSTVRIMQPDIGGFRPPHAIKGTQA